MLQLRQEHAPLAATLLVGALAATLSCNALAAEGRGQRYSPGVGGSDMTAPLSPGWYGQVAMLHYHATKLKDARGNEVGTVAAGSNAPTAAVVSTLPGAAQGPATASLNAAGYRGIGYNARVSHFRADAYVMLPRVTYLSTKQLFGANIGFTAMLPLVERQTAISAATSITAANAQTLQAALTPVIGPTNAAAVASGASANVLSGASAEVNRQMAARTGSNAGIGDLEMSPVLRWEIGDNQAAIFTPTVIFPTGEYDKDLAVNPGFGNFYTFRPSVQYAFIGDGWDVGARLVLSFNTRNKDTKYRSGNMLNVDFQAMKFVSEDLRLGLQGYVVQQFTKDSSEIAVDQAMIDAADGNKMRAYALGPAVAWIKDGGDLLLEGKVLREFGARNRAEGTAFWLMLSKPFGL